MEETKPEIELVGHDGNSFAILGRCQRAARRAGKSEEWVNNFREQATSGDYNKLLQVVMEHFEIS